MGLDIYLYTRDQREQNRAHERVWDEVYALLESGDITEEEKDRRIKAAPGFASSEDTPSLLHPDAKNINNRRYLRSSYNGGGFNSAVPRLTGDDNTGYYEIFAPVLALVGNPREEELAPLDPSVIPGIVPALQEARDNALRVARLLRESADTGVSVTSVSAFALTGDADHLWRTPPDEQQALAWYKEAASRPQHSVFGGTGWSDAKGTFLGSDPFTVLGWVPGQEFGRPCVHLIYKANPEVIENYAISADIVSEFCEEAIALIEADGSCEMSWSG